MVCLTSVLGVNKEFITNDTGIISVINAMETSYQAASEYSIFSGGTGAGVEGGWYGFKRRVGYTAYAILMLGYNGIFQAFRISDQWHLYWLSTTLR